MLKLLLAWALAQAQPAELPLPPPPEAPAPLRYLPVRVDAQVAAADSIPADARAGDMLVSIVDGQTLRVAVTVRHDELEHVNAADIRAWRAEDDLQIVIPLVSNTATPFEPRCCITHSQADLMLTLPAGLPTQVTVRTERPQLHVIGEQRLVPQH
ncbi:hypothetical protein [Pseudoxanthomonas beigongshangi]